MDEVRARLIEELRLRTEERVSHWNQLGDWCRQRPGRYIGVEWRPDLRGGSSSATDEDTNKVTGAVAEEGIGIRLENEILITADGCIDLMEHIPIEAEQIEDIMNA